MKWIRDECKYCPVRPDPVQTDGCVLDEIGQFTLAPAQLFKSIGLV